MSDSEIDSKDLDLLHTLETLTADYQALLASLEEERDALRGRSYEALASATQLKSEVCARIEQRLNDMPMALADWVEAESERNEKVELLHTRLCAVAREAKDFNAVNGKVISRSQQSVRELIGVFNGHDPHALYGAHGATTHGRPGTGPAFVHA